MSGVIWELGTPQVDRIAPMAQAGWDHGQQVRQQNERRNALSAYAANPNDPGAQNALLVADPAAALQFRDQRLQEEAAQRQRVQAELETHRDRIIMGARIFRSLNVQDEAGYQRALLIARQSGMDLSDVPQHYDPSYVSGVIATGQQLSARQTGPTVLNEGAVLVDPATGQTIASGNPQRPRYYAVPPGGTLVPDPSASPAPQETTATNPQTGQRIRLNPQTGQWEPMTGAEQNLSNWNAGGAPPPNAAGTFR